MLGQVRPDEPGAAGDEDVHDVGKGWLLVVSPGFQQEPRMAEAVDRRAVAVHCVELTVIPVGESGNVIEENAGVQRRLGVEIAKDDQGFFPGARPGDEFLEGVPESREQLAAPVTDHHDDIGVNPLDDMGPTYSVMAEHGIVVVLDASAGEWGDITERALNPTLCHLSTVNRGVDADHPDLVTCRIVPKIEIRLMCLRDLLISWGSRGVRRSLVFSVFLLSGGFFARSSLHLQPS